MAYKLNITERADEMLDNLVYHLTYRLKNKQAATHLLDCIDVIYDRLEVNPFQFSECRYSYLANKGYREAVVLQMDYIIIFYAWGRLESGYSLREVKSKLHHSPSLRDASWTAVAVYQKKSVHSFLG